MKTLISTSRFKTVNSITTNIKLTPINFSFHFLTNINKGTKANDKYKNSLIKISYKNFPRIIKPKTISDYKYEDKEENNNNSKLKENSASKLKESLSSRLSNIQKDKANSIDEIIKQELRENEEYQRELKEKKNKENEEDYNELSSIIKSVNNDEKELEISPTMDLKPSELDNQYISKKDFVKIATKEQPDMPSKKQYPLYFSSNDEDDFESKEYEMRDPLYSRLHELDFKKNKIVSYETVLNIPEYYQKAAVKVFSKYKSEDIREWTKKYLLLYSQNHAVEPPLDLTKLKSIKFGNSDELNIKTKMFNLDEKSKALFDEINNINSNKGNADDEKDGNLNKSSVDTIDNQDEVEDLTNKLTSNKKESVVSSYLKIEYNPSFAVAYLYSRAPHTMNIIIRILKEVKDRNPDFRPQSVLDYGAGLGSGILASMEVFGSGLNKFAAVEPNKYMRKLGRFVVDTAQEYKETKTIRDVVWVDSLALLPGTGGMERGKFDLIILSHVLQEVRTAKGREMIVDTLYSRLSSNGVLVVIEPGSPKGFRFINDFREWIREKQNEAEVKENKLIQQYENISNDTNHLKSDFYDEKDIKELIRNEKVNILSPCPHSHKCPLAAKGKDWCHFSQLSSNYSKSTFPRIKKGNDTFNEKFSFLVVKRGDHILNEIKNVVNDMDLSIPELSYKWARIIRPIINNAKHCVVDICNIKGEFERKIVALSHGKEAGYKVAKKAKWGDLWMFPDRIPNKFRKENDRARRLW